MKVIDLSQTFENNMSQFPGTPKIQLEAITSVEENVIKLRIFILSFMLVRIVMRLLISFQAQPLLINYP